MSDGWRAWARELGDWWQTPASLSGRYHAPGETQWQHARIVLRIASKFWRRVPDQRIRHHPSIRRSYLRAAMLHDCGKAFDKSAHDLAGYSWMLPRDPLAAYFILTHMGRWQTQEVTDILECPPIRAYHQHPMFRFLGEMIQSADYIAAVCYDVLTPHASAGPRHAQPRGVFADP